MSDGFRSFAWICLATWILAGAACKKESLKADIPAYLYIPEITLTTDNATQGTNAHGITDAWVLVDGRLEGVFGLPANFPLLYEGKHQIEIFAGVRKNGSASFHVIYPMFNSYVNDITLTPGKTDTIHPGVTYKSGTNFVWLEDFEDQATSLEPSGQNTLDTQYVKLTNNPAEVFNYGPGSQWSLKADMDTGFNIFEYSTKDSYNLPKDGKEVYLEVHINANYPVQFGVYAINTSQFLSLPILITYPTEGEWKKFYIRLNDEIVGKSADTKFKIFIGALNVNQSVSPVIFIDNLKLVYIE